MKHKEYSDDELRRDAQIVLTQHFGHANTLRFLSLHHSSEINYLEVQENLFEKTSTDELYKDAETFWNQKREKA